MNLRMDDVAAHSSENFVQRKSEHWQWSGQPDRDLGLFQIAIICHADLGGALLEVKLHRDRITSVARMFSGCLMPEACVDSLWRRGEEPFPTDEVCCMRFRQCPEGPCRHSSECSLNSPRPEALNHVHKDFARSCVQVTNAGALEDKILRFRQRIHVFEILHQCILHVGGVREVETRRDADDEDARHEVARGFQLDASIDVRTRHSPKYSELGANSLVDNKPKGHHNSDEDALKRTYEHRAQEGHKP
mmetsp:Transcript_55640/g.118488  ORF Transcript_55640/g.118488 Transcript_55640/m.118488 type:complete len:247 (-) Transcript_55640:1614-2354(-)